MTIAGIIGLDQAPTTHGGLLAWVRDVAALTDPDEVVWCDGSDAERERLTRKLIDAGTLIPQQTGPRSFRCALDPDDVARGGPTHLRLYTRRGRRRSGRNWMEPVDMKIILTEEYRGCMRGRTMYVVPFYLEHLDRGGRPMLGRADHRLGIRRGLHAPHVQRQRTSAATFGDDAEFVRCLHSVGAPRRAGQADVPWPCDHTKYVAQFPETRTIWSYGSGFPGNALLGNDLDLSGLPLAPTAHDVKTGSAAEKRRADLAVIESWFAHTNFT